MLKLIRTLSYYCFRIIHQNGFSTKDRLSYKGLIYSNVIQCVLDIMYAMNKLDIVFHDKEREVRQDTIIVLTNKLPFLNICFYI